MKKYQTVFFALHNFSRQLKQISCFALFFVFIFPLSLAESCSFTSPSSFTCYAGQEIYFEIILKESCEQPYISKGSLPTGIVFNRGSFSKTNASLTGSSFSPGRYNLTFSCSESRYCKGTMCYCNNTSCSQNFTLTILDKMTAIAAGRYHSLCLGSGKKVWAWGNNLYGQLGNGSPQVSFNTPVQVVLLNDVTSIAGGGDHSLALIASQHVWSWGDNRFGQLGDGTQENRNTPVQVISTTKEVLKQITGIGAGGYHSLSFNDKEHEWQEWTWGDNDSGQLGNGSNSDYSTVPVKASIKKVAATVGGEAHSLALKNDGKVWAWGLNYFGQLGDGTNTNSRTPVQVESLTDCVAIAAGSYHSLALKSDGTVWAWGDNGYGQLGNGSLNFSSTPVKVLDISGVIAIAGGGSHSLALKNDGTVWAWGFNYFGQLGDGTNEDHTTPVQVKSITNVMAIAAGYVHSLALKNDGTVWAWGDNHEGQLGNGTNTNSNIPVQAVIPIPTVSSVNSPEHVTVTQSTQVTSSGLKFINTIRWHSPKEGDENVVAFYLMKGKKNKVIRTIPNHPNRNHFKVRVQTHKPVKGSRYAVASEGREGQLSVPIEARRKK